jgi:hypothetical protein
LRGNINFPYITPQKKRRKFAKRTEKSIETNSVNSLLANTFAKNK